MSPAVAAILSNYTLRPVAPGVFDYFGAYVVLPQDEPENLLDVLERRLRTLMQGNSGRIILLEVWCRDLARLEAIESGIPFGGSGCDGPDVYAPGRPPVGNKGRVKGVNRLAKRVLGELA